MVIAAGRGARRDVERRLLAFGSRHEIAGIAGVGIAGVAVIREGRVGHEIEAVQQLACLRQPQQIRMLEAHTGVDDGHDCRIAADSDVPRLLGVRRSQLRGPEIPLIREQRVDRQSVRPAVLISDRVFDVGIGRHALEQRVHVCAVECAVELQHIGLGTDLLLAL